MVYNNYMESPMRHDAYAKVTGQAKYVDDLRVDGTLYVQAVRCPHPHAKIISIDIGGAKDAPGVICVLTAADVQGQLAGKNDKPVLVSKEAKHPGEGVALVVAETRAQAEAATELVKVKYKTLESVHTVKEALFSNAPLVHKDGNIAATHLVEKGDIENGFKKSDLIIEREYNTQRVVHAAIEPDGVLAVPENGGLTVYGPGKAPFLTRKAIAKACGLRENEVRLIQPVCGGAFGGKFVDINLIASRLAVAALRTGRPCKTTWSREEVFEEGSKRHPFTLKYKVGLKTDGKINAIDIQGFADAGAYATVSKAVIWRAAVEAAGPYKIDNVRIEMKAVFTNNVYSDGVRGFGSPQVDFACESVMNELAEILKIPPIEFRRINKLDDGDKTATSQILEEVNLGACLDKLEQIFDPDEKLKKPSDKTKLIGRGISSIFRGETRGAAGGDVDGSTVQINMNRDGSLNLIAGLAEMGQGTNNALIQIVSEATGLPMEDIRISALDTDYTPDGGPTTGSRGLITFGNAAWSACQGLIYKMKVALAAEKNIEFENLTFKKGRFKSKDKEVSLSFKEAAAICDRQTADLGSRAYWSLPKAGWDHENNSGDTYPSYNYAACGADVEVDTITGNVRILKLVSIHDVGKIINEEEVKGQILGGISMALGYSLSEDVPVKDGVLDVKNFDRYIIPRAGDMANTEAIPIEPRPGQNPLGVKGVGEPASAAIAPAIISAINNAADIKIRDLPATPEKILEAIEAMDKGSGKWKADNG